MQMSKLINSLINFGFNFWQSGELAESVSKIIDSHLADGVDMSEVQVLAIYT